jgi:Sap, sulfolipid-1-addressing protein
MNGVLGAILPLAIAVTISPVPIIAAILLLLTRKPLPNGAAYLVGFTLGVGVVLGLLVWVAGSLNLSSGSGPSKGLGAVELVLGLLLLVAAMRKFQSRPMPGTTPSMPKWMDGIASFTPARSLVVGIVIGAANPKNLAVGIAAAAAIASASLSSGDEVVAIVVYVVIAVLGVAAPLAVMLAVGGKAQAILDSWKSWLAQNNQTVMAVLFLVFAVVLIGKGIAAL